MILKVDVWIRKFGLLGGHVDVVRWKVGGVSWPAGGVNSTVGGCIGKLAV